MSSLNGLAKSFAAETISHDAVVSQSVANERGRDDIYTDFSALSFHRQRSRKHRNPGHCTANYRFSRCWHFGGVGRDVNDCASIRHQWKSVMTAIKRAQKPMPDDRIDFFNRGLVEEPRRIFAACRVDENLDRSTQMPSRGLD